MANDDVFFPDNESCPDCGCFIFRPGPRGGLAQNIECVRCKSRFNITRWPHPTERLPIVRAHRIPSEKDGGGEWREDMFPKVVLE
jgi:hypothetical protein